MSVTRYELYHRLCKDLSGTYIEVGTCWGGFAKWLLDWTPLTHLYCVDPYRVFDQSEYNDALNKAPQESLDKKFAHVQEKLLELGEGRVTMLRTLSSEAASTFKDGSLSFVYIDGNHCYKHAKQDILDWIGKVAPGGILAGDDVESMDEPHDENGDLLVVHSADPSGKTFGFYGVHKALIDVRAEYPWFNYTIVGCQFYWHKPAEAAV
jgi:hypothetical protein